MADYDDEDALTKYLWHNYLQLFTTVNWRADATSWSDSWTPEDSATLAEAVSERPMGPSGMFPDGMVIGHLRQNALLRERAARHVLKMFAGQVQIVRCAMCNRIVRTPQARQCLWCGFDWHASV